MNRVNIKHLNNQHNEWLRKLNFYKTELTILKGILTEIAGKNTGTDVLKDVEHFENQFKVQSNNIDTIAHNIHLNVDAISRQARDSSAGFIDETLVLDHTRLGQEVDQEEFIAREQIVSFRKFAERAM